MATDSTSTTATTTTTTAIDDLPDSIILLIFSFLPPMDVVTNASAVCAKWRQLSLSIPKVDFCIESFTSRFNHLPSLSIDIPQLFMEFVNRFILNRRRRCHNSTPLHEFRLTFFNNDSGRYTYYIDKWIQYAIKSNCKVLSLSAKVGWTSPKSLIIRPFNTYKFNFSSILNSSIQVLNLKQCDFCIPFTRISSLKSLSLVTDPMYTDFSMDVARLIPLCVNLEFLSLYGFVFAEYCKIMSLSLKELILSIPSGVDVEICAPNLRKVSIDSSNMVDRLIVPDALSLVEAYVHVSFKGSNSNQTLAGWNNLIASFSGVQRLTVQNMWSWYNDLFGTANFFENIAFNNLEYLKLLTGYRKLDVLGLELCLEMCPKLETLELELCLETMELGWCIEKFPHQDNFQLKRKVIPKAKLDDVDVLIEMETHRPVILQMQNLRQIKLRNFKGTGNELYVVELLKRHMVVLEKIIAFPGKEMDNLGKAIILWSLAQ